MSLAQQALDLAANVAVRMSLSGDAASKQNISDLQAAVQLLAQNALSATPSSENLDSGATSVDVPTNIPEATTAEGS